MDQGIFWTIDEYEENVNRRAISDAANKSFFEIRRQIGEVDFDSTRFQFSEHEEGWCFHCQKVSDKWTGSGWSNLVGYTGSTYKGGEVVKYGKYANLCGICGKSSFTPINHVIKEVKVDHDVQFAYAKSSRKDVKLIGWHDIESHFRSGKKTPLKFASFRCDNSECRKEIGVMNLELENGLQVIYMPNLTGPVNGQIVVIDTGIRFFLIDTENGPERRDYCSPCSKEWIDKGLTDYTAVISKFF